MSGWTKESTDRADLCYVRELVDEASGTDERYSVFAEQADDSGWTIQVTGPNNELLSEFTKEWETIEDIYGPNPSTQNLLLAMRNVMENVDTALLGGSL